MVEIKLESAGTLDLMQQEDEVILAFRTCQNMMGSLEMSW